MPQFFQEDNQVGIDFLISALDASKSKHSLPEVLDWVRSQLDQDVEINQTPLQSLKGWSHDEVMGTIRHASGKFFSINGIHVATNVGLVQSWDQPIINQPEVGILGILARKINGVLHLLLQAKIEPGNVNRVQLSPTLQATKSNYLRVHKGAEPLYLKYFTERKGLKVLLDQLQSEQGARFLRKRNRNIIIEIPDNVDIPLHNNYIWLTLGQIKELLHSDNLVNMDTRTVISGIRYPEIRSRQLESLDLKAGLGFCIHRQLLDFPEDGRKPLLDLPEIFSWLTGLKTRAELTVSECPINRLENWVFDGNSIQHADGKYFSVIGVTVRIGSREVTTWDQPMIRPAQEGLIGFILKRINDKIHFLVQAKLEPGNFDVLELAPTVQCLTGNYRIGHNEYTVPFIDTIVNAPEESIWYSTLQSEEGGRFFEEQNRNIIVEVDDTFPVEVPDSYCWMTLSQLNQFVMFNNYVNIAARSLLAAISPLHRCE
jgi:oxidase EvaA